MMRQRPGQFLLAFCVLLLCRPATVSAQEYYGVPIEDGGVAFLLDVSGSMDNRGEQITGSIVRGLAAAIQGTSAGRSAIGRAIIDRAARTGTATQISKMESARRELVRALDSLRDGTNFTIITFGQYTHEWPAGVRTASPAGRSLARQYISGIYAAGGTPMAEALQLGFEASDVRTLFVVTDGRPTSGEVLRLVQSLQESRTGRRMVINTVGIGSDQDGGLLCQLALDNEGIYVRDGQVACTFSPCSADDGIVTFYPPSSVKERPRVTRICSSAEHPDCTPNLVYETMLSEARFQTPGLNRTKVTNCLDLDRPDPVTIVIDEDGLEATTYTRPGHPSHAGKITRIVKRQNDVVVVETSGAGKLTLADFEAVDQELIEAVRGKLQPPVQTTQTVPPAQPAQPEKDASGSWKKDPATPKKKRP
jgi:von Willebrand factor type A domain